MSANLAVSAYALCGFLIVLYAWVRSARPARLVLVLLLYVALGGLLLAYLPGLARRYTDGLAPATKLAHLQLVTVGVTVWLLVTHAIASRAADSPPRFFFYVVSGIIAVTTGALISLGFHSPDGDQLMGAGRDLRAILFSVPLCVSAAFFRDHRSKQAMVPAWLQRAETSGCTAVMILGLVLLYLGELFPFPTDALHGWRLAAMLAVPSALAVVIVGCVPHRAQGAGANAARKQLVGGHGGRDLSDRVEAGRPVL
jgi:hypothetical protein